MPYEKTYSYTRDDNSSLLHLLILLGYYSPDKGGKVKKNQPRAIYS